MEEEEKKYYQISLPIFEGPLDLLLTLIKDNKIDIYDIPIAFITNRYLEYLKIMKDLNLDIAGEFIVIAATLIYIKSRMLLPKDEAAQELEIEIEDPRLELVEKLLEYQSIKEGAFFLKEKEDEWINVYSKEPSLTENNHDDLCSLSLYDLIKAFRNIFLSRNNALFEISKDSLTIKDKIDIIISMLSKNKEIIFDDILTTELPDKIELITCFLALMEILKLGLARAYQRETFGTIWIKAIDSVNV
ncbi:segregation and condensation protein A [Candidatus Magnetoovum chiemensis]|nr:segregation and condensation protein A [Candidatus Magnetoovum chiemensis]